MSASCHNRTLAPREAEPHVARVHAAAWELVSCESLVAGHSQIMESAKTLGEALNAQGRNDEARSCVPAISLHSRPPRDLALNWAAGWHRDAPC